MTHLGLCSAIAAASKGFAIAGFRSRHAILSAGLIRRTLPVVEPDLDGLLRANRARIRSPPIRHGLTECDLVYVAPDVPTDDAGKSDLAGLDRLLALVLAHTRAGCCRSWC